MGDGEGAAAFFGMLIVILAILAFALSGGFGR